MTHRAGKRWRLATQDAASQIYSANWMETLLS